MINIVTGVPQTQNVYNIVSSQTPISILTSSNNMMTSRPTFPVVQRVQQSQPVIVQPQSMQQVQMQQQQQIVLQQRPQQQQQSITPKKNDENNEDDDDDDDDDEEEEPVKAEAVVKAVKQKRGRKKKDPNAPPAALSAYAFFFRETQAKVKAQNPAAKFGDVSRSVAGMWEALSENEKSIYRDKSAEDHARHDSAMKTYKASLPVTSSTTENATPKSKSVKVVYLGGKMVTTTTTATAAKPSTLTSSEQHLQNHPLFQGLTNVLPLINLKLEVRPEDVTENECIRHGCSNFAIKSPEWEDEYCSNACAIKHCKNVFADFVAQNLKF